YLAPRDDLWHEPIYRNIWGYMREFDDSDVARLHSLRALLVERSRGPILEGPPAPRAGRSGAAPGRTAPLSTDPLDISDPKTFAPFDRILKTFGRDPQDELHSVFLPIVVGKEELGSSNPLRNYWTLLTAGLKLSPEIKLPTDFSDGPLPI